MAGSIIISKDVRLSLSTNQFDYLTERVRSHLESSDSQVKDEVYFPMDEGGMMFISAESLDAKSFMAFSMAVLRAQRTAQSEDFFPTYENVWTELVEKLRRDARFEF